MPNSISDFTGSRLRDWVVYKLGDLLSSVGHKVKIHKITPTTDKERGDIEIKTFTFAPYWSTHTHKEFRRYS